METSAAPKNHTSWIFISLLLAPVVVWFVADVVQRILKARKDGTVGLLLSQIIGGTMIAVGGMVLCGIVFLMLFQLPLDEILGQHSANYIGFIILGSFLVLISGAIVLSRGLLFKRPRRLNKPPHARS